MQLSPPPHYSVSRSGLSICFAAFPNYYILISCRQKKIHAPYSNLLHPTVSTYFYPLYLFHYATPTSPT
ncbi:Uncharacterized protein HZ326_7280 [Fusarium oxysporum f. sp. albedinis]|nr:Uncharacterized protein HZ326_7280 [Fusarium oxysporum f. sp. albedinis]